MSWAVMGISQYGLVTTLLRGPYWWPSGFWMQFTILVLNKSLYGASSGYLRNHLPPFRSSQLNSVTYWDFSGVPSLLQCLPRQASSPLSLIWLPHWWSSERHWKPGYSSLGRYVSLSTVFMPFHMFCCCFSSCISSIYFTALTSYWDVQILKFWTFSFLPFQLNF